ncbi:MAG: hypothetical protein HY675_09500 [Chloroflexi bacterium]|nr:hypothetical protein [Chloroflexota bacterium]
MDASHINEKELAPLVSVGYESPTLDYKGPASWTAWTNRDKVELVRDITGMANGDVPGYLIVGVSQQPSGQFALCFRYVGYAVGGMARVGCQARGKAVR